jgi:hypothetical protein
MSVGLSACLSFRVSVARSISLPTPLSASECVCVCMCARKCVLTHTHTHTPVHHPVSPSLPPSLPPPPLLPRFPRQSLLFSICLSPACVSLSPTPPRLTKSVVSSRQIRRRCTSPAGVCAQLSSRRTRLFKSEISDYMTRVNKPLVKGVHRCWRRIALSCGFATSSGLDSC